MRHLPPAFDTAVSAFREMTSAPAEGAATRARVLMGAQRRARWRRLVRPGLLALALASVISSSAAALTAAGFRWRAPPLDVVEDGAVELRARAVARADRPIRSVPASRQESAPSPDPVDNERRAYERAHQLHFFADAPGSALAAWDRYLAIYPRGTFAPEARYNRSLCLARLGRFAAAADGLRPFAAARVGGYRRDEACRLLAWLAERDARVEVPPACSASE
jgi:hypothetical protein